MIRSRSRTRVHIHSRSRIVIRTASSHTRFRTDRSRSYNLNTPHRLHSPRCPARSLLTSPAPHRPFRRRPRICPDTRPPPSCRSRRQAPRRQPKPAAAFRRAKTFAGARPATPGRPTRQRASWPRRWPRSRSPRPPRCVPRSSTRHCRQSPSRYRAADWTELPRRGSASPASRCRRPRRDSLCGASRPAATSPSPRSIPAGGHPRRQGLIAHRRGGCRPTTERFPSRGIRRPSRAAASRPHRCVVAQLLSHWPR